VDQNNAYDFYDSFGFQPDRSVMTLNGFSSIQDTTTAFAEAQLVFQGNRVKVVGGANYERGTLQEEDRWTGQNGFTFDCGFVFYANEVDWTTGQVLNRDHPCYVEDELRARTDSTNTFYSAFVQADVSLHERVKLTLGGRYDSFERESRQENGVPLVSYPLLDGHAHNFSPKAALSVRLASRHYAYATYGEGFNSNFGPIWQWDPGQYLRQDVKPTTLRNFEAGFKGNATDRLSYALAGFFIRQNDRPIFLSNPAAFEDFTQPPNIVTTGQLYESRGIEVSTRARVGERTSLFANYSLIDAEWKQLVVDTFEGPIDLSGNTPQGVPRHVFSAGIEQRFGRAFEGRAWWESYSDYFITQDNSRKGGGYGLLNAALTWRAGRGAFSGMTLTATNLLDEEYYYLFGNRTAVVDAVPGVPFQAKLTVDLSF
jgi:outer membrane receptor protein involved in Fe transport